MLYTRRGVLEPYNVMALYAFLAAVLCYVDRTNMSIAMIPAAAQHGWDKATQGVVFAGFFVGYATTQVLGGVWAETYGGARVLLLAVVTWSFFTLITPSCAASLGTMMLARIGLGAGEGVAMPALQQITSTWYPEDRRTQYNALISSGNQLGIVVSLLLSPWVARSWETVFHILGLMGVLWALLFVICPPRGAFSPNTSTATYKTLPWSILLRKKPFWAIYISHFGGNFGFYILITWLPEYFVHHLGVPLERVGEFTIPAYVCGAVMANVVGAVSDRAIRAGWEKLWVRKAAQTCAMGGCSFALVLCTGMPKKAVSPLAISLFMCIALASHGCHPSGNMANIMDIAPNHAGIVQGISNTIATLAGVIGNLYVGFVLPEYGWPAVFGTAVGVYLGGLLFFCSWASATPQLE